jgi:hypothetical protein
VSAHASTRNGRTSSIDRLFLTEAISRNRDAVFERRAERSGYIGSTFKMDGS